MELRIDPEFQALCPPLTEDERRRLDASLLEEGCRDALMVWTPDDGIPILLDGHNRYAWCQAHDAPCRLMEAVGIQTREDAKVWIISNQLGRRNLKDFQRIELAEMLRPLLEARARENQGRRTDLLQDYAKGALPVHTHTEIARAAGVSRETVRKAEVIIHEADESTKEALRKGETSIHHAYQTLRPPKPHHEESPATLPPTSDHLSAFHASETHLCSPEDRPPIGSDEYVLSPDPPEDGEEWDNWVETVEDILDKWVVVIDGLREQGGIAAVMKRWPITNKHAFVECAQQFGDHWSQFVEELKSEAETITVWRGRYGRET